MGCQAVADPASITEESPLYLMKDSASQGRSAGEQLNHAEKEKEKEIQLEGPS